MAPWGGMSKLLGTNPFSCSFPAGKFRNFTLDIATSASAMGKIIMYSKEGKSIPHGWAMDISGNDTDSAKEATDAFNQGVGILPMAGYKGTGIAIMIDVLAGILGAMLAQFEHKKAVELALHLHGLAGDLACEKLGEYAMGAIDIICALAEAEKSIMEE